MVSLPVVLSSMDLGTAWGSSWQGRLQMMAPGAGGTGTMCSEWATRKLLPRTVYPVYAS
jgi:hypothetical protein